MAQLTITVDDAHVPRILAAFQKIANASVEPGQTPPIVDNAWLRAWIKRQVVQTVRRVEEQSAAQTALTGVTDVE